MQFKTAEQIASMHNADIDSVTTVSMVEINGLLYEMRVCSVGRDAHFEWVNNRGDMIGDAFYTFTADTKLTFEAKMSTKH